MPTYTYPCLTARQRQGIEAPEFCTFFAPAGEVLAWAAVERIQDQGPGFQRLANPARVRGIKRFFEQDARNTIPTAVTVTLRVPVGALEAVADRHGLRTLTLAVPDAVSEADKPGLVIDGQHRLLGANAFAPSTPVPVVSLLNPTELETAFQFLVINNKSARVSPDHIQKLALSFSREGLERRLHTARLSLKPNYALVGQVDEEEGSPFRHLIRWPTPNAKDRPVVPAAVEASLQFVRDQQLQPIKDDPDALVEFFYAIWSAVRRHWADVWDNPQANLLTKVGVVCMTQYLTESLARKYEWGEVNLTEPEEVGGEAAKVLNTLTPEFWLQRWRDGGLDTSAGRQLVIEDLTRIARNRRARLPWFEELTTINRPESVLADA